MERSQACENAAAEPAAVSSLGRVARGVDFDVREVAYELVVEALAQAREEAPAAGKNDVTHEDLAHVRITRRECLRDQRRDRAREVWIRRLER
jgi:hypothetical protein